MKTLVNKPRFLFEVYLHVQSKDFGFIVPESPSSVASSELQFIMIFLLCRFALIIRSVDKTKSLCKFYFSTDAKPRFLYKPTPLIDKKISLLLIKKRTELVFAQTNARCMSWTPSSIPLLAQ